MGGKLESDPIKMKRKFLALKGWYNRKLKDLLERKKMLLKTQKEDAEREEPFYEPSFVAWQLRQTNEEIKLKSLTLRKHIKEGEGDIELPPFDNAELAAEFAI